MSLFPAYSSTSSSTDTKIKETKFEKTNENSDKQQTTYDWLTLNSFNDQKVVELNNEIIVDKITAKSEDKHKDKTHLKSGNYKIMV